MALISRTPLPLAATSPAPALEEQNSLAPHPQQDPQADASVLQEVADAGATPGECDKENQSPPGGEHTNPDVAWFAYTGYSHRRLHAQHGVRRPFGEAVLN